MTKRSCFSGLVIFTLAISLLSLVHDRAAACEEWGEVSGIVEGSPSGSLYALINFYTCVSDENGNCDSSGSYLMVRNTRSDSEPFYWTSMYMGQYGLPIHAGKQEMFFISVYKNPNDPHKVPMSVRYCIR